MKLLGVSIFYILILSHSAMAQMQDRFSGATIFQGLKKLKVMGSVLYIAAHPDDENTRLIAYLANEKLYRTAYLSLTRGDGGQNLIGEEQGVELGLIRTQELLAARRIDGGEQFFTRAYDFGYSKNPDETLKKWDHEQALSDVVWVIRKFQPDIIITRFPTTGEGGHGHHTASAILANEAFIAAADASRFKEQLQYVKPWQAKRILWNTFNFGGTNTTNELQLKIDAGGYNALLGKSYGEIAAYSRSQHKSQGFGSAASRGESIEYFKTTGGDAPLNDLMEGVQTDWNRIANTNTINYAIDSIVTHYNIEHPEYSTSSLVALYSLIDALPKNLWQQKKLEEVKDLILQTSGLYVDAFTSQPFAVQTDSIKVQVIVNNRAGSDITLQHLQIDNIGINANEMLPKNKNKTYAITLLVLPTKEITQPYWLHEKMDEGHYHVNNQQLIGQPDITPAYLANIELGIYGKAIKISIPVSYKYNDPVKGEIYQPLFVIPPASVSTSPDLVLQSNGKPITVKTSFNANKHFDKKTITAKLSKGDDLLQQSDTVTMEKGDTKSYNFKITTSGKKYGETYYSTYVTDNTDTTAYYLSLRGIQYDHIPNIKYFYPDRVKVVNIDLKTVGKKIGYIEGAGDKVADALQQMGYEVVLLNNENLATINLQMFQAIITGVRAYNVHNWLNAHYNKLMQYVKDGGNLIVQYNTSSRIGPLNAKISPYDFTISRNRITDEESEVRFVDANHQILQYPNKITTKDFEGWVQERSIYNAANWDKSFTPILSINDKNEPEDLGTLLTAKYGKGVFTYTGLVFFRELPAGVSGAYRLLANLIALNTKPVENKKSVR